MLCNYISRSDFPSFIVVVYNKCVIKAFFLSLELFNCMWHAIKIYNDRLETVRVQLPICLIILFS